MMIIINKDISRTPYYTEAPSVPMSVFETPYSMSCPSASVTALAIQMLKPVEALSRPSKKRIYRKVGFGPDVTLAYIESAFEFTQEEKDDRWYRSSQISSFKDDARKLCRTQIEDVRNGCSIPRHSVRNDESSIFSEGDSYEQNGISEDSIRGLAVYSSTRQRYCKKFVQHVLEAYHVRCVGNDEHVALLAEKWSTKSLNRALHMAKKDFLAAYFPEESGYESLPEDEKPLPASTLMRDPQQQQGSLILTA